MRLQRNFKNFLLILLLFASLSMIPTSASHGVDTMEQMDANSLPTPDQNVVEKLSNFEIPTFNDTFRYELDIVFLGLDESRVDETLLVEELPGWYAPIDRFDRFYGYDDLYDVNYTLHYNFQYVNDASIGDMREYFFSNANFADEPVYSLDNNDTYYIPSNMAESYLRQNYMTSDRPTFFVLDLYSFDPAGHHEHLYNASEIDIDGDSVPRPYGSQYQIAGGGEDNRLLWIDLSVGGSDYRDTYYPESDSPEAGVNDTLIPNVWDPKYNGNITAFTIDVSKYIATAIELRYIPSYLYTTATPIKSVQFEFVMFNLDGQYDFKQEVDMEFITQGYSELNPFVDWQYSYYEYDWQSDTDFVDMINLAKDTVNEYYQANNILNWLDNNLESLVNTSTDETLVLPLFLFGLPGSYSFDYFLGVANNNLNEFAYTVSVTNVHWSTPGYKLEYDNFVEDVAFYASPTYNYLGLESGYYNEIFETNISTPSALDFYILDQEDFEDYQGGNMVDLDPILFLDGVQGDIVVNVSISTVDNYYFIASDPNSVGFDIELTVDLFRDRSFGFTFVAMHEVGHGIGLSHPHDGYTWSGNNVYEGDTDYLYWLWDLSYTQMTYASHARKVSQMDVDSYQRNAIPKYADILSDMISDQILQLEQLGNEYMPNSLASLFETANINFQAIETEFTSNEVITNLNDTMRTVFDVFDYLETIQDAIDSKSFLLQLDLEILVSQDVELRDIKYDILLTNSINFGDLAELENDILSFSEVPWDEFELRFYYNNTRFQTVTGNTWEAIGPINLVIPDNLLPDTSTPTSEDPSEGVFLNYSGLLVILTSLVTIHSVYSRTKRNRN